MPMPINDGELAQACDRLTADCLDCGACVGCCPMLQKTNEPVKAIAARRPSFDEAYACSLCRLCGAVCPAGLCPGDIFGAARREMAEQKVFPAGDYAYLMADRSVTPMSLYREKHDISYAELALDGEAELAFLPGCTLMTYSPLLTRRGIAVLKTAFPRILLLEECCGLPLAQLGFPGRGERCGMRLIDRMKAHGAHTLVTACPNCYSSLQPLAERAGLHICTIYSVMAQLPDLRPRPAADVTVTLHDSCPDRAKGVFADEVRRALTRSGYTLKEMERNRSLTPCCGSGGQISHFAPELSNGLIEERLAEAGRTGADVLACYCMGCTLNFAKNPSGQKVRHVLNLLFGLEEEYSEVKAEAARLFQGPEGEENWERVTTKE